MSGHGVILAAVGSVCVLLGAIIGAGSSDVLELAAGLAILLGGLLTVTVAARLAGEVHR